MNKPLADKLNFQRTCIWIGNTLHCGDELKTSELYDQYIINLTKCDVLKHDSPTLAAFRGRLNRIEFIGHKLKSFKKDGKTTRENVYFRVNADKDFSCNWLCDLGKKADELMNRGVSWLKL